MARRQRYHLPGATYHVILRGNAKERIFFTNKDCVRFSLFMQEGIYRFKHRILAYCFMSNHVHLVVQVANISLSEIMQNLSFRYTRYINSQNERIGHLFQGRFKSILIDSDRYLKSLVRYVHLNPVRAGLVNSPENYKWSSHNAYLGNNPTPWLNSNYLLRQFCDDLKSAVICYENFIRAGIGLPELIDFKNGTKEGVLGDDNFVDMIRKTAEEERDTDLDLPAFIDRICELYSTDVRSIIEAGKTRELSHVRALLALLVRESDRFTLEQLASIIGKSASGLSKLATRLSIKQSSSEELQNEIFEIKKLLF